MTTQLLPAETSANDLATLVPDYNEIMASTDRQYIAEQVAGLLSNAIKNLARLAVFVRRADELGIEFTNLQCSPLAYLRQVGQGSLVPELFQALAVKPRLLDKFSRFALADQRRIALGESFKVVELDGEGGFSHRLVGFNLLTKEQMAQVFTSNSVRGEAEQVNYLRARQNEQRIQQQPTGGESLKGWIASPKKGVIFLGDHTITRKELLTMLGELT